MAARRVSARVPAAAAQHQRVDRDGDGGEDHGEDHQRVAPAVGVDQRLRERQEDEARQRGDERERGQRAPSLPGGGEPLREHHERGLVEHGGHDEPDADPERVEGGEPVDARPGEHEQRAGDRAAVISARGLRPSR